MKIFFIIWVLFFWNGFLFHFKKNNRKPIKKQQKNIIQDQKLKKDLEKKEHKKKIDLLLIYSQIESIENEEKGADRAEKIRIQKEKNKLIDQSIRLEREVEAIEKVKKHL